MPRLLSLRSAVLVWLIAECLALLLVVKLVGWSGAILIGLVTSAIGVVTLRRLGLGAVATLRQTMAGRPLPEADMLDGTLAGIGAVLLLLPGFASDAMGLALAAPSIRRFAMRFIGTIPRAPATRAPGDRTIDLGPQDWRTEPDEDVRKGLRSS